MNVKPLLLCSLVTLTAAVGCFVVSDKPADSAPPPAPTTAAAPTTTAAPTAEPTTTAAPTSTAVAPVLKAAPQSDAGATK